MDEQFFPQLFGPAELSALHQSVTILDPILSAVQLCEGAACRETELIISGWGMPRLDAPLLDTLPQLRALFHAAGTIRGIVTETSWERGIRVTSAAHENAKPTAEFAFAEIILSLKRTWERIFLLREKQIYQQFSSLSAGCYGSTVGLLSLGKIGQLVAQRLRTLDVQIIAYDPIVSPVTAMQLGVRLCSLEELFATADVVSCHMPSTERTKHALNRSLFASMKPGATFINSARGVLVNEPELIDVLRERPDLYAVLDVSAQEPLPAGDPLFTLPNVVLTPHIAGSMGMECRRMGMMMVHEVERYLSGQALRGEVLREQMEILA